MLRLTTLGAVDLRDHLGHQVRDVLVQPKRVALLVFLAIEGHRGPVGRDRLVAMFWPESDAEHARNALSQAVHHLRQALGAEAVVSHGANAIEVPAASVWCDAVAFAEALERGEGELALDLYRGEFCPSLFVAGAPDAEQWLENQRGRIRLQAVAASRTLAERLAARGDLEATARVARRGLALRPDDEGEVRALLALLERGGDGAGALNAYREYTQRLLAELETEPAPETRRLAEAIRSRRESASTAGSADLAASSIASSSAPVLAAPAMISARPVRRRGLLLTAAAVLVVALTTGATLLTRGGAKPKPSVHTVAVFPFAIRGSANLGYLREGMMDLLSAKLDGVSGFRSIDPRSIIAATSAEPSGETADYAALARRLGADWYVTGDIIEIAGRMQVTGALREQGGAGAVATATMSGDTTHLFELVDNLTGRILAGLLPGRDTALTRLASLTTSSLPALKAFLAGEQAMRAGRDAQAAEEFREAATLDTTFALAQYRLALGATWVLVPSLPTLSTIAAMTARAERNANRLSPLVRDLLAAFQAYKVVKVEDSEHMYRRIAEAHPDNVEAWFMLGETHFHYNPMRGRSLLASRADFQQVLRLDPGNAHALLHLARVAAFDGQVATLDSLAAAFEARYGDTERAYEIRTLLAAVHDDSLGLRALLRNARAIDPVVYSGMVSAAINYAQNADATRALEEAWPRSPGMLNLDAYGSFIAATSRLARGQWTRGAEALPADSTRTAQWLESAALLAANPALPLQPARIRALRDLVAAPSYRPATRPGFPPSFDASAEMQAYLFGMLSLRLGDSASVRRSLATLAAAPAGDRDTIAEGLARTLRAEMARRRGDARAALQELRSFPETWKAMPLIGWGIYERFMIAELLHGLGRDDEALQWYESFPAGYDHAWLPLAHLRQGQIYEKMGNAERARFHYTRLVRLWQDADSELQPMVSEARAALERLGGTRAVAAVARFGR